MMLFLVFVVSSIFGMYGNNLRTINSSNAAATHYFPNAKVERLIVSKYDEPFSEEELAYIANLEYVNSIVMNDAILDTTLVSGKLNEEYNIEEFFYFSVNSIDMLNERIIEGRLPDKPGEIVVRKNDNFYVGERNYFSNEYTIVARPGVETKDYTYRIVGFIDAENQQSYNNEIYMVQEDLHELTSTVVYENSMIELQVNEYKFTLTADVRIDDTLDNDVVLAYDTMFYDIMKRMGYIVYGPGDQEILLVEEELLNQFFDENVFYLNAYSKFEDGIDPNPVIMTAEPYEPHQFGAGIYVNTETYNKLFAEETYQITAVVDGKFEAKETISSLKDYNTFYPSEIITSDVGYVILLRNIQMTLMFSVTLIVIYFIAYFVLKNILNSKQKDYTINRSVGATNKNLRTIIANELFVSSTLAFLLSILIIYYVEDYIDFTILRYFRWDDYLIIYFIVVVLVYLISRRFNNSMFRKSVITTLKSEVSL